MNWVMFMSLRIKSFKKQTHNCDNENYFKTKQKSNIATRSPARSKRERAGYSPLRDSRAMFWLAPRPEPGRFPDCCSPKALSGAEMKMPHQAWDFYSPKALFGAEMEMSHQAWDFYTQKALSGAEM